MNKQSRLQKIIAPLALGISFALGANLPAISHPRYDNSSGNYHRSQFRNVQPFRSLNVTPRYYTPLPYSPGRYQSYDRYDRYDRQDRHYRRDDGDYDRHYRERRVHRRGFRTSPSDRNYRNDYRDSDRFIRIIRVK